MTSDFQAKTINRVTSGLRIVQSGDDAAGLAIANGFRSDQAVLSQGVRNANDGLSTLQTIDGGMSNISKLLDRARTLATQSASGTFTGDRSVLNSEFQSVMSEINRQAQAVGMNQGGTLAKNLSVFIGGGKGANDTAALQNGSIGLDLSKSTVDTKSLGLDTYRAVNSTNYDLGSDSTTSVSKIVAGAVGAPTTSSFVFRGAGFGGSSSAQQGSEVSVSISLSGLSDTAGLAAAINQAIYKQANPSTATDSSKAFKAAGITASVVTDNSGNEQLAFSSASGAFQVRAGDAVAGAFLGNIADSRSGKVTGEGATVVVANNKLATLSSDKSAVTLTLDGTNAVTLAGVNGSVTPMSAQQIVDTINADILADSHYGNGTAANQKYFAELKDGKLAFTNTDGTEFNATFSGSNATFGFTAATTTATYNAMIAGGTFQSAQDASSGTNTDYAQSAYMFKTLTGTQKITVNAQHADGSSVGVDITLQAGGVSAAIDTINDALRNTKDSALQDVVAVRDQNGIRFMSSHAFKVALADSSANASTGTTTQGEGLSEELDGNYYQAGKQFDATTQGVSGMVDISNQAAAQAAVASLASAVQSLGQSQAVVGRGQNQFNYAVNLAQSQLSNLAAAESRIRDADLASEATNLTKAQILMQAGVAALAQANSAPQQILSLLKG